MYHTGRAERFCHFISFVCVTWFCRGTVAQIAQQPSSQSVLAGATAVFNCSLPCSSNPVPVTWYLTMPDTGRSIAISQYTSFSQVKAIYGIELSRGSVDECSVGGYRVEQLAVNRPSRQLNLMPVQCAALCFDSCPCSSVQVYFSKYALLLVSDPPASSPARGQSTAISITVTPTQCIVRTSSTAPPSIPTSIFSSPPSITTSIFSSLASISTFPIP